MDEELKNLIEKAEKGDIQAMVMVGDCYNRGIHTAKNDDKAQIYYKMAADKGNLAAAYMTAVGYWLGTGVKKDKSAATKYMQFAADKGFATAKYMLGVLYSRGEIGLLFREEKALYYLEKASRQGHAKAQVILGDMNIQNDGAQYSLEKGLYWLVCAYLHGDNAKEESKEAMDRLNMLLKSGLPGGRKRIDQMITSIKASHPSYTKNPKWS